MINFTDFVISTIALHNDFLPFEIGILMDNIVKNNQSCVALWLRSKYGGKGVERLFLKIMRLC